VDGSTVIEDPPVLTDGVVTLRCLTADDVDALLAGEDDDQVRWLNEGHRSERPRTTAWVAQNRAQWRDGGPRRHLGVLDAATGELAGTVEAHLALPDLPGGTANVSYAVLPAWRGRGYAVRAVRLLRRWLAERTDATSAVLRVDAANVPSLRVARDAGCLPPEPGPDGLLHHALPLREPARVVLVCGPAGSGKSTHAARLARAGWAHLAFDAAAWAAGHREHPLPADVAARVHEDLRARLVGLVGDGVDVVVDTSFWSRASRASYRALLAPLGVVPVTHHLVTPRAEVLRRLAARTGAGPDDVVVPPDRAAVYLDGFEDPTPDEGPLVRVPPA
jgi:RimJ/RimL family protein N-acetyltransferase/predicted kinase